MNERIAALDFITQCLGVDRRPKAINKLRLDITCGRLAWEQVVSMANHHLVTPALWAALNDKGLVEYLPEDLHEYLRELHHLNKQRNEHLKRQAMEAVRQLNRAGIEPVLLKGVAHIFTNTYSDLGARIMTDLDMLVLEQELNTSLNALYALGYRTDEQKVKKFAQHHHYAPLFRPGDYGAIEVHRDLMYRTATHILPTQEARMHAEPLLMEGLTMKVLSPTYGILHNLLHSEIVDRNYQQGIMNLRSLHDLVCLSVTYKDKVDWLVIRELMARHGKERIFHSYIYIASRLFGMAIPDDIKPTLGGVVHHIRSRALIRWASVSRWDRRIRRFSAYEICRRYHCDDDRRSLIKGRIRYTGYLVSKYSSKKMMKFLRNG